MNKLFGKILLVPLNLPEETLMSTLPIYVWVLVLTGLIAAITLTCFMLYDGARSARPGRTSPRALAIGFLVASVVWAGLNIALGGAGRYEFEPDRPRPLIALVLAAGVFAILVASRFRAVATVLARPDAMWRLTVPQIFRVVGVAFVIVMALGKLPAGFAIPAGVGDVAIGVEAAFLARRMRRGPVGRRALWFNVLGLADLLVATGIAVAAAPGVAHVLRLSPTTVQVSELPLVLIPTTMVPLAVGLHVLSLRRIAVARRVVANPADVRASKVAA